MRCLDKFTELCWWYGVTCTPTVTALQTFLEVCHAYDGPNDIVYNTTKTVFMLVRPKQLHGRFSTRVRLGNEELSFVEEFRYLWHIIKTVKMMILKKTIQEAKCSWQYAGQEVLICTYWGKNPIVQVILLTNLWMCSLASFIMQNSIRKLTVSYSDTFKRLINAPRYTSSSLAFAMNATDHINVVFRKSAYSLMSRAESS